MALVPPFWFHQRQGKFEATGDRLYKLTAPNLPESFIGIRREGEGWAAAFRRAAEGPDLATTAPRYDNELDAWNAAFELYRNQVVI